MSRLILFFAAFLLIVSCEDRICNYGYCSDGECVCMSGFSGENCQIEPEPNSVIITKVEFEELSGQWFDRKYDKAPENINPDVYLRITYEAAEESEAVFTSNEIYQDCEANSIVFQEGLNMEVPDEHMRKMVYFKLYDKDVPPDEDDLILYVGHALYWSQNDMPPYHEFYSNYGVRFRVHLEYRL